MAESAVGAPNTPMASRWASRTPEAGQPRVLDHLQRMVMDLMPAGVYTCDATGKITYFNRRAAELWQLPPEHTIEEAQEARGRCKVFEIDGRQLNHPDQVRADVLATGEPIRNREVILERPDGSRIVVLANIDPIKDEAGNVVGAINVFQDVTTRRGAEQTVRSLLKLSEKLHATLELEALLDALAQETMALVGAELACAGWHTAFGMVADKCFGRDGPIDLEYCWRQGEGLPGWLLEHKVPYLT